MSYITQNISTNKNLYLLPLNWSEKPILQGQISLGACFLWLPAIIEGTDKNENSGVLRYSPLHRWKVIFLLNQKFINHMLCRSSYLVTDVSETLTASTNNYSSDKAASAGNLVALFLLKWLLTTQIWFTVNTLIRKKFSITWGLSPCCVYSVSDSGHSVLATSSPYLHNTFGYCGMFMPLFSFYLITASQKNRKILECLSFSFLFCFFYFFPFLTLLMPPM